MTKELNEVGRLAVVWWKMHRPLAWDQQRHLEQPVVNTVTEAETLLALAVAKYVESKT